MQSYALLFVGIVFGVAGQLLLKFGMTWRPQFRLVEIFGLVRNWPVLAGFVCYGISVLLYLHVLAKLDLSLAYPTVSLGYVLVIIMSRILFKESVSPIRWVAISIICIGVALVGIGSE